MKQQIIEIMVTPEEILDKNIKDKPLSYSIIIQSMKEYAIEVAKETQRRCAENAKIGGSLIRDKNNRIIGVTNPTIDKSSIMDPENLAI